MEGPMKAVSGITVACLAAMSLTACGKDPATQAARDHSGAQASNASYNSHAPKAQAQSGEDSTTTDARDAPVPKAKDGKPMWTANKRHTAEENAQYAFQRDGEAFGATDIDDFVAKAHAFTSHPPAGIQKISRSNGDVELYDAKTNVFAVVSKEGAPRTMFKPDTGADYWAKEEAKNQDGDGDKGSTKRASRKKSHDADEG
jgi:pyocin large subunit-like protein